MRKERERERDNVLVREGTQNTTSKVKLQLFENLNTFAGGK